MASGKTVHVLVFRDQNGHTAEVYQSPNAARDRVADIIYNEIVDMGLDRETQMALRPVFRIEDLGEMVEEYERLKRELRFGDESERMWAVRAPMKG